MTISIWVFVGSWIVFWMLGSWAMRIGGMWHIIFGAALVAAGVMHAEADFGPLLAVYGGEMIFAGAVMWPIGHWRFARKYGYWKSAAAQRIWFFATRRVPSQHARI